MNMGIFLVILPNCSWFENMFYMVSVFCKMLSLDDWAYGQFC